MLHSCWPCTYTAVLTCYFLLNFVIPIERATLAVKPSDRLAIFFWILSREICEEILWEIAKNLLFSFEFCGRRRVRKCYLGPATYLAIFFWILSRCFAKACGSRSNPSSLAIFFWILCTLANQVGDSRRVGVRPCYFLLNFVLYWKQCITTRVKVKVLAIFFWILSVWSTTPPRPYTLTCYFLLNFVGNSAQ